NKMGYKYKFYVDIHDKDMFKIIKLSIPIIIGVSVSQVNIMVDKSLSSYIGVGSMTLMSYANKLNLITFSIIVTTIVTINYPILIKLKANNKIKQYEKTLIDIINIMCILLI
ncbi:lipid II flippase MurJ, partial [Clostridium perfringens]